MHPLDNRTDVLGARVSAPLARRNGRRSLVRGILTVARAVRQKYRNLRGGPADSAAPGAPAADDELDSFRTGSAAAQAMRISGDWRLDQKVRDVFVSMFGEDGTVPSESISDIRRDRQHPLRFIARRIREARRANVPKEKVKPIAQVIDDYIEEVYAEGAARKHG